jgi:hypothetical protein
MGANADAKLSIYVTFLRIDRFLATTVYGIDKVFVSLFIH